MLHLQSLGAGDDDEVVGTGQMDVVWVARWLDDIGLPQYKGARYDAPMIDPDKFLKKFLYPVISYRINGSLNSFIIPHFAVHFWNDNSWCKDMLVIGLAAEQYSFLC